MCTLFSPDFSNREEQTTRNNNNKKQAEWKQQNIYVTASLVEVFRNHETNKFRARPHILKETPERSLLSYISNLAETAHANLATNPKSKRF